MNNIMTIILCLNADNSHFELVIQQLQAQSKQGKEDESHEPSVASEDKCGDEVCLCANKTLLK